MPPPGEARSDFDIFLALAEKLGVREELYPNWKTTHDAFLEWQRVSAGRLCDYSKFTWQQIDDANGLQWGGESLYRDGIFPTPDGRAKLHTVPCEPFKEQPDSEYNFILNTGRTVEHRFNAYLPYRDDSPSPSRGWCHGGSNDVENVAELFDRELIDICGRPGDVATRPL